MKDLQISPKVWIVSLVFWFEKLLVCHDLKYVRKQAANALQLFI